MGCFKRDVELVLGDMAVKILKYLKRVVSGFKSIKVIFNTINIFLFFTIFYYIFTFSFGSLEAQLSGSHLCKRVAFSYKGSDGRTRISIYDPDNKSLKEFHLEDGWYVKVIRWMFGGERVYYEMEKVVSGKRRERRAMWQDFNERKSYVKRYMILDVNGFRIGSLEDEVGKENFKRILERFGADEEGIEELIFDESDEYMFFQLRINSKDVIRNGFLVERKRDGKVVFFRIGVDYFSVSPDGGSVVYTGFLKGDARVNKHFIFFINLRDRKERLLFEGLSPVFCGKDNLLYVKSTNFNGLNNIMKYSFKDGKVKPLRSIVFQRDYDDFLIIPHFSLRGHWEISSDYNLYFVEWRWCGCSTEFFCVRNLINGEVEHICVFYGGDLHFSVYSGSKE